MQYINKFRTDNLSRSLDEAQIDALLILIEENRRYLSGFTGKDTGYDESAGALLITQKERILLTDSRYTLQAQNEATGFRVITYKTGLAKELPGLLADLEIRDMGYEKRKMTCEQFETIEMEINKANVATRLIKTTDMVEKFRIIKDEPEVDAIKKALFVAESAFGRFLEILEPGMKEIDAAWELEKQIREAGAQSVSFPVIVAAGSNAALPHATPGYDAIQPRQPVLIDWGAQLNGYCSDTSRTITIGRPDKEFAKIFTAVYDAQQKATEAIRPGVFTKDIDAVARDVLKNNKLDFYFGHGLGHGVGLAIHEQPSVSHVAEKNTMLEENMVFTVEPGVYIPGWGGVRLENMVVVRHDGAEVLNNLEIRLQFESGLA